MRSINKEERASRSSELPLSDRGVASQYMVTINVCLDFVCANLANTGSRDCSAETPHVPWSSAVWNSANLADVNTSTSVWKANRDLVFVVGNYIAPARRKAVYFSEECIMRLSACVSIPN